MRFYRGSNCRFSATHHHCLLSLAELGSRFRTVGAMAAGFHPPGTTRPTLGPSGRTEKSQAPLSRGLAVSANDAEKW